MSEKVLKVRVSLKGRPVKAVAFKSDSATIGRDPGADIYLDNPGISREHARIERTPSGTYRIVDLNSANGIFVNEQQVKTHFISNNDVVFIGKFALWFTYEEDRRGEQNDARRLATTQDEGTTVLKTTELQEMIETLRVTETAPPMSAVTAYPGPAAGTAHGAAHGAAPGRVSGFDRRTRSLVVLGLLLAFAAGYVAGGGLRWVPWQKAFRPLKGAISSNQH
jgi:hypothetical protein